MNASTDPALRYSIDRVVMRGRRIFGWGWAAHRGQAIRRVTLCVEGDGWARRFPANHGLERKDVQDAHPDLSAAGASGFVITGYVPSEPLREASLRFELADGREVRLDITGSIDRHAGARRAAGEIRGLARATWRRLIRGDVRGILARARAQRLLAPTLDSPEAIDALLPRLRAARTVTILFDHDMGGGANLYRRGRVDERIAAGESVLLCTYNLPTLDYRLRWCEPGGAGDVFRTGSFLALERILDECAVAEIFVNSVVSFDEPRVFVEWLATVRATHPRTRLTIAVHEYFAVCPSFVLLDADGRYCGIPDPAVCASCLPRHRASYVALSPPTLIGPWRASWGRCLAAADEIRCFSESTRRLLLRAFPTQDLRRLSVVPHRVDFRPARLPRLDHAAPLVIGVIGNISEQKGAGIVREMVAELERSQGSARVVVVGTLDAAPDSRYLTVTGAYARDELVDRIEAAGINVFLFPSVCPETFSYAVEELMLLEAPVVAFDLGAPGDRLRGYANARLCTEVSAAAALEAAVAMHERLSRQPAAAPL